MSNGNGGQNSPENSDTMSPLQLIAKVSNQLVDNSQILGRYLGGFKAAALADEDYDLTNEGFVNVQFVSDLKTLHPEVVAQADNSKPTLVPSQTQDWSFS